MYAENYSQGVVVEWNEQNDSLYDTSLLYENYTQFTSLGVRTEEARVSKYSQHVKQFANNITTYLVNSFYTNSTHSINMYYQLCWYYFLFSSSKVSYLQKIY